MYCSRWLALTGSKQRLPMKLPEYEHGFPSFWVLQNFFQAGERYWRFVHMCLPSDIHCSCKGNSSLWFYVRGAATLALVSGFFMCSKCLTAAVSGFLMCSQWLATLLGSPLFCSWWYPSLLWVTGVQKLCSGFHTGTIEVYDLSSYTMKIYCGKTDAKVLRPLLVKHLYSESCRVQEGYCSLVIFYGLEFPLRAETNAIQIFSVVSLTHCYVLFSYFVVLLS